MLRFSDGVNIDPRGPWRKFRLSDGWYVAGHGMLIPCTDREDAEQTLKEYKEAENA